ncbi:MAG: hypothetical protein ABIJ12_15170 [bacterium]
MTFPPWAGTPTSTIRLSSMTPAIPSCSPMLALVSAERGSPKSNRTPPSSGKSTIQIPVCISTTLGDPRKGISSCPGIMKWKAVWRSQP